MFSGNFLLDSIRSILSGRVKIAAISLDELISSKSKLNKNSLNCRTGTVKAPNQGDNTYVYNVVCSEKDSKKGGHRVSIEVQGDPTQVDDKKDVQVKVNCTCPAFVYQGAEYNLHKQDALLGTARGNLQAPKTRDPVRVNYGCKHIYASIRQLLNTFKLEKPITEKELEQPEVPQETPFAKSPFSREEQETAEKFSPFEDRVFSKEQEVPKLLLPSKVDNSAVEEMQEDPSIIPKLFERPEAEQEISPFRKKVEEPPEDIPIEEVKEEAKEEVGKLPSQKPLVEKTPEVGQEDKKDKLEAIDLKKKKRKEDEEKLKTLRGT